MSDQDKSEIKEALAALRQSKEHFRTVVRNRHWLAGLHSPWFPQGADAYFVVISLESQITMLERALADHVSGRFP